MRIDERNVIDRPVDEVYPLIRDDLAKIVPYLPNVSKIEQVSYERTDDDTVEIVNHWFAIAEVPGPAKKVLKPELFSWKDYATWHDAERRVEYRLESCLGKQLYDARGTNTFGAVGDRTELHVSCTVDIHADRIPGVPKIVLSRVMPIVEKVLEQLLAPNLRSVGRGVAKYFRDQ